ncbi:MAG: efflux RND transporter permease subunit [Bradymonadia bacterium]
MSFTEQIQHTIERVIRGLVAHKWVALVVLFAFTGLAGWWGTQIQIRSDMEDLFPEDTPQVVRARKAREILRTPSDLQILIGSDNQETNRAAAAVLAEKLAAHTDLITEVEYRRDVDFFEKNALLYLPIEDVQKMYDGVTGAIKKAVKKKLSLGLDEDDPPPPPSAENERNEEESLPDIDELKKENRGEDLREYFESPDGQVLSVKAYPNFKPSDETKTRALMEKVNTAIAEVEKTYPGLKTTIEGDYTQLSAAVDQIRKDLASSSSVALGIVALILAFSFRRIRAIFLIVVPLLVGLAWTMAFARLTVGYLNLITAFIFAILVGLGIDFAVHAMSRVNEEARKGKNLEDALASALTGLGRPMVAAMLTTMATFGALMFFDFRGFSQFGFIAAAGVALCLLAVYLVLPPLAAVIGGVRVVADGAGDHAEAGQPTEKGVRLSQASIGVLLVIMAIGATRIQKIEFEGDMRKMRPPSTKKSSALKQKYRKEAETRNASPALVITDNLDHTASVHTQFTDRIESEPLLDDVVSIYTFIPEGQKEKLRLINKTRKKLKRKYGILEGEDKVEADKLMPYLEPTEGGFGVDGLPDWVKTKFTDVDGTLGRYVLLYPNGPKSNAPHVLKIQDAIGEVDVEGKTYYATAPWMITGAAYTTVKEEGPVAVGLAALVVLLLLTLDLRRPRRIALAYIPLITGFVIFLGALAWLQVPLNLFNIVVLPTIFGIGVDTAIHLLYRVEEEEGSVKPALATTGVASGVAALTTAVGFASLLMVNSEGLQSIGSVAVVGIAAIYVTTTSLTAAFVTIGRHRRLKSGGGTSA